MGHHPVLRTVLFLVGFTCLASAADAGAKSISWSDLRPDDQPARSVQPLARDRPEAELLAWRDDAQTVDLTGFILPIDQEGDLVYEFMLVPWAGACSHSASPAVNQLVHVYPEEPFRIARVYEAITVTAMLRPGFDRAQLFIMDGTRVLDYGYSMRHARVAKATKVVDPDVRALPPGSLLSRP
ncbi:DUF3299 domain-containing protein [Rhizobium sp. BT03]|uniref:DUF3299 domain-containing protein n=1 Tax=Rhizobium sp. BT03 TaxID=3045156 RepID=UPI0024B3D0C9|nr:DUF3299 domain-containing protein [Rhizobium sp. BT03]WHO77207.1 DUF3299 domain-containing protein [Rhizobium sp. BT03]